MLLFFPDDVDSSTPRDFTFPVVLVPNLKCEALHRDYFQASGANAKDPSRGETRVSEKNPKHVTNKQSSFTTTQSSTLPSSAQQSHNPCSEHFLSHEHCQLQSNDQLPQFTESAADRKESKSTSLSDLDLFRLPSSLSQSVCSRNDAGCNSSDDGSSSPGLTQSCHEYYITRHTPLNDTQRSHDIKQTSLIGGSCTLLQSSELISCTKSTTHIQQAKKRCIPKVGIRTIPLIKIKPESKFSTQIKKCNNKCDTFDNCDESKKVTAECANIRNNLIGTPHAESSSTPGVECGEVTGTNSPDETDVIGEVIVHEYSRDSISPEDEAVEHTVPKTLDLLDNSKRELSVITEEYKLNDSESESSLQSKQNCQEHIIKETESVSEKIWLEQIGTPKLGFKLPGYKGLGTDDPETVNTNDSLFVNKDEDSLNTVTDICEEEFCTQYSDTEEDLLTGNHIDERKEYNSDSDTTSEYDNVLEGESDDDTGNVEYVPIETVKPSKSAVDGIVDIDKLERKLKARTCLSLGRDSKLNYFGVESVRSTEFRNIQSDSEGSLFYSCNSLDNSKLNESCGALSKGSRRLPLKWTPKILLESRISSLTSGTFSESSFHTADTFGTFYSAQSFPLDSCDNFQTCEDFTQYDNNNPEISKSKFSKAKDALLRGKDFVKAKLDDYRKRFPNLRRINLGEHSSCQRSCGFSCVHVGKEISQYSLPDTSGIKGSNSEKGDYPEDSKGDYCKENCCTFGNKNEDEEMNMDKTVGFNDKRDQKTESRDQNKGSDFPESNGRGYSIGGPYRGRPNGAEAKMTVKMELNSRETIEDDLPVGSEAICIPRSKKQSENGDSDGKPLSKRLRWVSALEKTQGSSISSSFASNSSVEQVLTQRQMDPESMLRSLGFDGGPNTDESATRIPERFLLNPCSAKGINIFEFVLTHPELQHMVPSCEQTQQMHAGRMVNGHGAGTGQEEVDGPVTEDAGTPVKGSMQHHHFSSVLQGVRFLHNTQSLGNYPTHSPHHQVPDEEMREISTIPSVLDFPNRRFLARQGFYGREYAVPPRRPTTGNDATNKSPQPEQSRSISAEQRRKQFHHSGRSKNWSLTEDSSETDDSEVTDRFDPQYQYSIDQGLYLRSFSERFSSESSLESMDSFGDRRDELRRQNSISHLRKQYQDTIGNSIDMTEDSETPVFDLGPESDLTDIDSNNTTGDNKGKKVSKLVKQPSISEVRKQQVDKLMSAQEDDGDYFAHSLKSSWRQPILKRAQNSTQSTLTGSPNTPKEFKYSFENELDDGESEFVFPPDSNNKVFSEQSPAVSIVIEDEVEEQIIPENTIHVQTNPNELIPSHLIKRTDSSTTIVQGDSEHSEGELTPRPGDISPGLVMQAPDFIDNKLIHVDALSESTGSSATWTTVLPNDRSTANHLLKPDVTRPQESFELEEISSAENALEDINGNSAMTKSKMPLGQTEKSLSTHSDSSGFADIDQLAEMSLTADSAGEITQDGQDMLKGNRGKLKKQKTFESLMPGQIHSGNHDNQLSSHQTENRERNILGPMSATVNQENSPMFVKDSIHSNVHVCQKVNSVKDTENVNPALQSIAYIPDDQLKPDKSVVYTMSVPMTTSIPKKEPTGKVRYVSSVKLDVDSEDMDSVDTDSVKSFKFKQAGPVLHKKLITDLDPGQGCEQKEVNGDDEMDLRLDLHFVEDEECEVGATEGAMSRSKNVTKGQHLTLEKGSERLPSNRDIHVSVSLQPKDMTSESVGERILLKRRCKEALIAATSHTADWLLSNERQVQSDNKKRDLAQTLSQSRIGKPLWASTPDLNSRSSYDKERNVKNYRSNHAGKSLDIDEMYEEENEEPFTHHQASFSKQASLDESTSDISYLRPASHQNVCRPYQDSGHFAQETRQSFLTPQAHKSVPFDNSSYAGSSYSMPEDQVQYLKLAKLVNGPSIIVGTNIKMPIVQFTPNIQMKDWTLLPKHKHLEEETRLMQHAVQRYKVELIAMETMLFNMKQVADQNLNREERLELEELQHLWSEVRREVNKMEELLSLRLSSVVNGNSNYNPLDAVEIVHSMIQLLREQLFHQQISIERDMTIDNLDEEDAEHLSFDQLSSRSLDPRMLSDLSQQMSDIKRSMSQSQLSQKEELRQSLSELKDSILSEVRDEASTQNVKMLQLQVQAREHEIKRLRLELLQQNIEVGKTRKRQMFESDV